MGRLRRGGLEEVAAEEAYQLDGCTGCAGGCGLRGALELG